MRELKNPSALKICGGNMDESNKNLAVQLRTRRCSESSNRPKCCPSNRVDMFEHGLMGRTDGYPLQ